MFKRNILPYVYKLKLSDIISILDNKKICNRGNIAHNFGWHSMNFRSQGQINIPCHSITSSTEKDILKNMTFIMRQVFTNQVHPIPFSTNKRRTLQFANQLVQSVGSSHHETYNKIENVFESATFGMTYLNNPLTMLKPHIDFFNCHEIGFNNVFGIYFNMEHPEKKITYTHCFTRIFQKIH